MTRTWWQPIELFKLDILAEANADIEQSSDVFGRKPSTLAYKARDAGLVLPAQWARLIAPKRKKLQPRAEHYPYIMVPRDEHADLLAVNAIIPKSIPDHMRADMCQEIMVAILEGRTTLEQLKDRSKSSSYFIKKFYHDNYEQGGHAISFNDVDEDWDSDAVASSIAAKEWLRNRDNDLRGDFEAMTRTYTPAIQFEAAWRDQVGRARMKLNELGQFLTYEEVEEMLDNNLSG